MLSDLFGNQFQWTTAAAALGVVLVAAWAAAQIAARAARAGLVALSGETDRPALGAPIVQRPIRVIETVVFLIVSVTLMAPALDMAGAKIERGMRLGGLVDWLLTSGLHVALVAVLAYGLIRIVGLVVLRLEAELSRNAGTRGLERAKRARTLGRLIRNVANTVVIVIASLMVLQEFGINIMPVLTGAGILGLAVGFGAQTLVRDVISGFFLIFEDQVRVGDVATINGTTGSVEAITLRTVVLRDLSGTVHVFPNGAVQQMSNRTKDFSYYVLDMGVAYKEDTDRVVQVMRDVSAELQADAAIGPGMLEPIEILGVDAFEDSQVVIKARLKTVPLAQWAVGREYRRRLKKAFDAQGIEIPFPHVSVYFGEASKPFALNAVGTRES
jgi:moderate conductance mechanosensitive channel